LTTVTLAFSSAADVDGDEHIDFVEFIKGLTDVISMTETTEKIEWAYDLYDLNKDGSLTLQEIQSCMADDNASLPWTLKHLKKVFSDTAVREDSVTKHEFCSVARYCSTLTFPAFIILDTVRAKAADMNTKDAKKTKDLQADWELAAENKLSNKEVDRLEREIRDIETEKDQDRAKVSAKGQIGRGLEGKKKVSIRDRAMGAAERSGAMVTARVAKRMKPEASKKSTRR